MPARFKLWLRKKTLMALRAIIWHADEWLHAREVKLRKELGFRRAEATPVPAAAGLPTVERSKPRRQPESFQQWEARRSGIAVVSKKEARRRRQTSTSAFDSRFVN